MSSQPLKTIGIYFAAASAVVILPWGIPFMIKDVGTVFLPLSALLSLGGFLLMLGYTVVTGKLHAALGVLLVPCTLALLFYMTVYQPASKAVAECHVGATQVQKAQNQTPRHIILDKFYHTEMVYDGTELTSAFAVLKGAEVLSRQEGGSGLAVHSLVAKDIAICGIPESERRKGEYADRFLSDRIYLDQSMRRIDRCLVSGNVEPKDLEKATSVIFRINRLGGLASTCHSISIVERDSSGKEKSLGTVKYDFAAKKIYPPMGNSANKDSFSPLYEVAKEVFGEAFDIQALRRHIVD